MRKPAAVSMKESEYTQAKERADRLGLNFSAYVNALIRADLKEGGRFILDESQIQHGTLETTILDVNQRAR